MKILILIALLLSGCSTMTSAQLGDLMARALAAKIANSPGYDYKQGMRDSQAWNDSQMRAMQASQCGYGGPCPTVNVRIIRGY